MLCTIPGCFVLLAATIITSPICAKHLRNGPYCNTQDALCYGDGEANITLLICMVPTFLRADLILAQHKCGSCASQCKSEQCTVGDEWVIANFRYYYYVHIYSRPPSNQLIGIVFTFLQAELVLARRICGISANSVRTISVTSTQ